MLYNGITKITRLLAQSYRNDINSAKYHNYKNMKDYNIYITANVKF